MIEYRNTLKIKDTANVNLLLGITLMNDGNKEAEIYMNRALELDPEILKDIQKR